MTDKELIKQEIERLKHNTPNAYDLSRFMLLEEIESFIDSLPEEPVSEDLEEEIERWIKEKHFIFTEIDEIIETARHFAEWQKQQMMKDAVNGEVVYQIGSSVIAPTDIRYKVISDRVYIPNVKLGDKVKIIIIKLEQQ